MPSPKEPTVVPISNWMKTIGTMSVEEPPAQPVEEKKTETAPAAPDKTKEPDGKTASPERPDAGSAGAAQPVGQPASGSQPAEPSGKPVPHEKAPTAADLKLDATNYEDEKWPRVQADWAKFKERRREVEQGLQSQIKEREAKLAEAQAKLEEASAKAASVENLEESPAFKAEIERRDALIKSLGDRLAEADVTRDPRFETYFGKKLEGIKADADAILGQEQGAQFIALVKMQHDLEAAGAKADSKVLETLKGQIQEMYDGLDAVAQSELGSVRREWRAIERERAEEIQKANANKEKLTTERKGQQERVVQHFQKSFETILKTIQHPEQGNPIFQHRKRPDGSDDSEWNAAVDRRVAAVREGLMGVNFKPENVIRGAFDASAYQVLLSSYKDYLSASKAQIAALEEQVTKLSAAQPRGGKGGTEKEEKGPVLEIKDTDSPMTRSAKYAAYMRKTMEQGIGPTGQ